MKVEATSGGPDEAASDAAIEAASGGAIEAALSDAIEAASGGPDEAASDGAIEAASGDAIEAALSGADEGVESDHTVVDPTEAAETEQCEVDRVDGVQELEAGSTQLEEPSPVIPQFTNQLLVGGVKKKVFTFNSFFCHVAAQLCHVRGGVPTPRSVPLA